MTQAVGTIRHGVPQFPPRTLLAVFALLAFAKPGAAEFTNRVQPASLGVILQGRAVYQKNCVPCHGQAGDGRGDMGLAVKPRPRNFRAAVFKFRSTPSGFLPTDDDLARTIRGGLTGTAMPTFATLRESELRAVVEYVKSFSPRWEKAENYAAPLPLPAPPGWFNSADEFARHAAKGKPLFAAACAPCHGAEGDGRGQSAPALQDSFDEPITPSDLRQPLRGGSAPQNLFRVLATGIDGTPMPAFLGSLSEEQLWNIIAHVMTLRREAGLSSEKPE